MQSDWLKTFPIAHRGLHSSDVPENSLLAFKKAKEMGFAIELDIHLLDCGEVVVFHDETTERALGVKGQLKKMGLEEIKSHALFGSDQVTPTLKEVLECVKGEVPLLIEIKERRFNYKSARALTKILDNYEGSFAIQSFNPYPLYWLRKNRPKWKLGILSGRLQRSDLSFFQKIALKNLLASFFVRPDFFGLEYSSGERLQELIASSLFCRPIIHWTVTNEFDAKNILANGRNIIFENFLPEKNL